MKLWMYFSFCLSVAIKTFHSASKVLLKPSVLSLSWWKCAMRTNHFNSPHKRYAVEMFRGVVISDENCLWLAINLSSMADYVDMCKAIISQFPLRHSLKSVLLVTSCPTRFDKEARGKKSERATIFIIEFVHRFDKIVWITWLAQIVWLGLTSSSSYLILTSRF